MSQEILKTYPFQNKTKLFQKFFFPSVVIEWNNLDHNIRNVGSALALLKTIS